MASTAESSLSVALRERPADSLRFDLTVALLSLWSTIGLYVDGWAHNHGAVDNTFFTPYHALLYSGILAVGLFLAITQYRNAGRGYAFTHALPYGYNLSLIGVVLFFIGGGFDFVWHSLFGFEANLSTLLSPSHLLLATAGVLIFSGPLRAAWHRRGDAPTWARRLPALLSLLMIMSALTFFTQFVNAFSRASGYTGFPGGSRSYLDALGVVSVLFPAAITMGVLLFALRRWTLPFGAVTLILVVNAAGMMLIRLQEMRPFWYVILAPAAAGLLGDAILWTLKPSREHPFALRVFGFAVPFALYLIYFLLLIERAGIWWEIHMWLGVSFFAAVTGLLLSYLALPPAVPE